MTNRTLAPYRVLYSNDTTNIETCVSPYHKAGEPFTEEMLRASVDETANTGVDVHLLQPGLGWVPWWKSKQYPFSEHVKFMKEVYGMEPSDTGFSDYMYKGGDMVEAFVDQCKKRGLAAFISMRMNDAHGHEFTVADPEDIPSWTWHVFSKWMVEHRHLRIADNLKDWNSRCFDYIHPEVRQHKLGFIQEIIEQYDIDGIELDFMRHMRYFDFYTTSFQQRADIICEVVQRVRAMLDAKGGRYRYLCIRVPAFRELLNTEGMDLPRLVDAGVDMVNVSMSYFTDQEHELAEIVKQVNHRARVYFEMCHCIYNGRVHGAKGTYDSQSFMRTTDEMYYSTADLAYRSGADGISFFNFVYYREHGSLARAPFNEPPFHVLQDIGDKQAVAEKACHYFLSPGFRYTSMLDRKKQIPVLVSHDTTISLDFEVGQFSRKEGRIRVIAEEDITGCRVKGFLNGCEITETEDVSELYDKPYVNLLPKPKQCKAFVYETQLLKEGKNTFSMQIEGVEDEIHIFMLETLV